MDSSYCLIAASYRASVNTLKKPRRLPLYPASIDVVVLSHAYLEHSGKLSILVEKGFKGIIFGGTNVI